MALRRMDNVLIVVDDLVAAAAFFVELGMELEGETPVQGPGRPHHRARLRRHGAELVGEIARYGDVYRLCDLRGPEGIPVGLAEEIG